MKALTFSCKVVWLAHFVISRGNLFHTYISDVKQSSRLSCSRLLEWNPARRRGPLRTKMHVLILLWETEIWFLLINQKLSIRTKPINSFKSSLACFDVKHLQATDRLSQCISNPKHSRNPWIKSAGPLIIYRRESMYSHKTFINLWKRRTPRLREQNNRSLNKGRNLMGDNTAFKMN